MILNVNLYTYLYYKWSNPFDHDNVIYTNVSVIDKVFVFYDIDVNICMHIIGIQTSVSCPRV